MTAAADRARPRPGRQRGDGGHASVFLIMLIPVLVVVFALVWEAGQMLLARSELMATAHSAARAGTHQVDREAALVEGAPVLEPDAARQAATEHLFQAQVQGEAAVEGGRVVVLARAAYTPSLLPIAEREIEAEASATAQQP